MFQSTNQIYRLRMLVLDWHTSYIALIELIELIVSHHNLVVHYHVRIQYTCVCG